ncbi:MAG: DUF1343 domain-containing protein [Bacteroidales bacterium]|nr:DUF1343 domain-containing protein [Bacteroidales bacterium]
MKPILTLLVAVLLMGGAAAQPIITGAQHTEQYMPLLVSNHFAVVANHSSLIGQTHLVDTLMARGLRPARIFCPEHGFRGTAAAGARVNSSIDSASGVEIASLYGRHRKPSPDQLSDLFAVVFDLQDVGCRFYTYISTLHYVMQACAEQGVRLIVLDRPNPNGHYVDGPVMDSDFCSFVGMRAGTPVVYGMTIGEYASMIDSELPSRKPGYGLLVVRLSNYCHDSIYHLPVPPSPALRSPQAIALYPSLCLFEATSISVGRGTPFPFEIIGNDGGYKMDLRGIKVPPRFDLSYLREMMAHSDTATFFLKTNGFERLAGNALLRRQLLDGRPDDEIRASWEPALSHFKAYRKRFLLYPEH